MNSTCKLWTGSTMHGYGQTGTGELAHRVAYKQVHGEIPAGLLVRHLCDTRLCVNPEHLKLGTAYDNYMDARKQGRHTHGTKSNHSGLTDAKVLAIRASKLCGEALAKQYGVSGMTISNIRRRRTWTHI